MKVCLAHHPFTVPTCICRWSCFRMRQGCRHFTLLHLHRLGRSVRYIYRIFPNTHPWLQGLWPNSFPTQLTRHRWPGKWCQRRATAEKILQHPALIGNETETPRGVWLKLGVCRKTSLLWEYSYNQIMHAPNAPDNLCEEISCR